jgi:hypothetical protein
MPAVPLSNLQHKVLKALASHRNPESYVAEGTALNIHGIRLSDDVDLFHDREEKVAEAARNDVSILIQLGFSIEWQRREPGFYAVIVSSDHESTRLEWVRDSDFRFFPVIADSLFGYRLHLADLATNKALAAASRKEPRDVLDLIYLHDRHLPLSAVLWAAVAKDPGYTPEGLISEIRRNARYHEDDFADLTLNEPVDASVICRQMRLMLDEAELFVKSMPPGHEGCLFIKDGILCVPDPDHLDMYIRHYGQRRGHWPLSSEIGSLMLDGL